MALYTLKERKLTIEVAPAKGHTVHGGQVAGMCKKLGLWALLRGETALDPRKDRTRGFAPEVMAAQLIVSFCCGGVSLADAERLQSEKGLKRALGVVRFADQTQLGEWLRGLGPEGVAALRRVQRALVRKALALCPAPAVRSGGELEVFFDDTQLEVTGAKIEGAAINYEGRRALGWQCLFAGPFLADQVLTGDNTPGQRPSARAARGRPVPLGRHARLLLRRLRLQRGQAPRTDPQDLPPLVRLLQPLDRAARTRRRRTTRLRLENV